ncbi:hypothetical protein BJ138DRAFT_1119386 [Hygrophoropsis aurantiaca]|uniref:Uncharacterized protein n=1 Tax=Hygrophoropsis aurantiaca TaxID=72124 RepID=A0ACB7ZUD3_9AGAM|nr:hypothetical protein BJ138DRAFT_1119386 [Hygrophoropsis aurantiaca]
MATNVIGTQSVVTQHATSEKIDSAPPEGNQNPVMGKKALKKAKKDQGKDPKAQEARDLKVADNNAQETCQTIETVSSMEKNHDAEANQMEGTATERTPEASGEANENVGNKGKEKEKTMTFASPNVSSTRVYAEPQETRETIPNVREAGEQALGYIHMNVKKWRERANAFPPQYNHGVNPYAGKAICLEEMVWVMSEAINDLDRQHELPDTDDESDPIPTNEEGMEDLYANHPRRRTDDGIGSERNCKGSVYPEE